MVIERHPATDGIQALITQERIKTFADIFGKHNFPRTALALYLHTNNHRMRRLIQYPENLTVIEIKKIADYFQVSYDAMEKLVRRQVFPFLETGEKARKFGE